MLQGGFYRIRREEGKEALVSPQRSSQKELTFSECLEEQCAYALSWGMPYSLFWDGPISAFNVYMEKAKIESLRKDEEAWMQGMYFMQAIGQSLSTKKRSKNLSRCSLSC